MTSIHDLHDIASLLGVELRHHNGLPKGWYSPSLRVISTMRDMAVWDYKTTLARELGHAFHSLAIDLEVTPHILEIYLKERPHILKELAA